MNRLGRVAKGGLVWALLTALLFALRPLSPPSADTAEIALWIEWAPWLWYLRWPLTHLACVGLHRATGLPGVETLALFSSMAGALFVMTVAAVARRDWRILLVFISSATLTLNGHAEVYAWPNLFLLWLLLLGPRHLEGRLPLAPLVGLFLLGALFHMLLLFYAPAVLWLAWRGRRLALARGEERRPLDRDLAQALGRVIAFALLVMAVPMLTDSIGGLNNDLERLVPLGLPAAPRPEQLLLLRPAHLEAIGVFLLLGCPLGVGLALLRLRRVASTETLRFTGVAALCAVGFLLLWHPDMGVWGDWDLFSHVGLAINVLAWRLWSRPSSLAPAKGDVIRSDSPLPGETDA